MALLETRGGLQREKREREITSSRHARGKPASTWKATLSYGEALILLLLLLPRLEEGHGIFTSKHIIAESRNSYAIIGRILQI